MTPKTDSHVAASQRLKDYLRFHETSYQLLATQLGRIQPSYGCEIDLVALAGILNSHVKRAGIFPQSDSNEWAETIDIQTCCERVERSNTRRQNLKPLEDALNGIHYYVMGYANGTHSLVEQKEEQEALSNICQEAEEDIIRIADALGVWIKWYDRKPESKPRNYWRDDPHT